LGSIGFQGGAGALYRLGPRPLACAPRRRATVRGAAGLCRVRARPGVGESPDGLAPRGRERKRKGGEMTGWAGGKGNGPAGGGVWVAGEEKEKGEVERAVP
jgi:hypothetical protein